LAFVLSLIKAIKYFIKPNANDPNPSFKQVMSVAFSALHQTLKSDPKMINIIYKILTTNDRKQYKIIITTITLSNIFNPIMITYYLAEKHYENLVEALTNNAINASSSNPIPVELPVTIATSSPCGICIVC
jgi:dihydroorotase